MLVGGGGFMDWEPSVTSKGGESPYEKLATDAVKGRKASHTEIAFTQEDYRLFLRGLAALRELLLTATAGDGPQHVIMNDIVNDTLGRCRALEALIEGVLDG